MAAFLPFVLAAAISSVPAVPDEAKTAATGVRVQASATVTILRAETASETTPPGGITRHVSRRSGGQVSILFE